MSGETEQAVSGWTTDTLHAHLMGLIVSRDTQNAQAFQSVRDLMQEKDLRDEQRFQSLQRAIDKAEEATEKRFEGVNEFRQQLGDQARTFLPRLEYDRAHTDLVERVDHQRSEVGDHLSLLDNAVSNNTARRGGGEQVVAYVVAAIGAIVGIVGVAVAVLK